MTADAAWVGPTRLRAGDLFDPQVTGPGGEVVVFVGEPLPETQTTLTEANLAGVVAETGSADGGNAVLGAVDDKPVQMFTAPPERGLQCFSRWSMSGWWRAGLKRGKDGSRKLGYAWWLVARASAFSACRESVIGLLFTARYSAVEWRAAAAAAAQ
jgi:hypothetical protein